jgi:hypothetical protein
MQDPIQGAEPTVPNETVATQASADGLLAQYSDSPMASAATQGAIPEAEQARRLEQSLADQRLAEVLRLQNEMKKKDEMLQQFVQAQRPQSAQENPYDPATQYHQYNRFEQERLKREIAEETRKGMMDFMGGLMTQAQDMAWQQKHPNVDINTVKSFAQYRGVQNLDDAYLLMTMSGQVQSAASQATQNAFKQFQQPANAAQPLRGVQSAPQGQASLSFAKLYQDFTSSNGAAYNSWNPEVQKAFDMEWRMREAARAAKQ